MVRLFDDFAQFDLGAHRGIEGTGLGLAISRNLTKLMGGDVTCRSVYGEGSVFTAVVRQRRMDCPPLAALRDPTKIAPLVVGDPDGWAGSVVWTLERLGLSPIMASDVGRAEELMAGRNLVFARESLHGELAATLKAVAKPPSLVLAAPLGGRTGRKDGIVVLPEPLFCIPLANLLNDVRSDVAPRKARGKVGFTAPDASVLIVDDLAMNLKVAKGLLTPFKLRVDVCESGQEALRMVAENRYDLIFMDHMMPGMDGLEATEKIRSLPEGTEVPIVALTANAVTGVKELFLEKGMNDFISKPIEIQKLINVLERWIPKEKRLASAEPSDERGARVAV
jgi:CheY-like chemotaxis protein